MNLLFSYYGDDFTGSTDALEALAANGVRTVLFTGIPDEERVRQFTGVQAIGIAGESRSRNPAWMEAHLPAAFRWLRSRGAPVVQYKVCSTFDSSPDIGNIAVAMRIGRAAFASACVPVVVAAPHLRRYVLFGNLFAAGGSTIFRIDRHPTMSRHPVTPMRESDLRIHLSRQGSGKISDEAGLLDVLALTDPAPERMTDELLARGDSAIVFDGLDERTEAATGRILWDRRERFPFVVGSSGLTHSLIRHWRGAGLIPAGFTPPEAAPVERAIAISGSCSPVTEGQIRCALTNGFEGIDTGTADRDRLLASGLDSLARGRSLAIYSALGPNDLRGNRAGEGLGRFLGGLLRDLVTRSGVRRAIIAGGDTSSHAVSQLGIDALTFAAVMAPGAPLCRAHSGDPSIDGLEIVLKGGQVGPADFFERVRKGQR